MITRNKVVLVTGAGASIPYGFPSAVTLTRDVVEECRQVKSEMCRHVRVAVPSCPDLQEFGEALHGSEEWSIDAFLERNENRHFRDVGRACIAWQMLKKEALVRHSRVDAAHDWMRILINKLREGVTDPEQLEDNTVTVITFNFDGLLEHRWRNALKSGLRLGGERLEKAVKTLEVIHVNGDVSLAQQAPTPMDRERAFGDTFYEAHVRACYRNIGFFHDGAGDRAVHEKARATLFAADVIAFLGFSFHPLNVKKIGLPDVLEYRLQEHGQIFQPAVYATGYDMLSHEREVAVECVCGEATELFTFAPHVTHDSAFLLREYPILDTRPKGESAFMEPTLGRPDEEADLMHEASRVVVDGEHQ